MGAKLNVSNYSNYEIVSNQHRGEMIGAASEVKSDL